MTGTGTGTATGTGTGTGSPGGWAPVRPLPIGAFPLPFGFLLLPADCPPPLRQGLLAGRVPQQWPDSLRGHRLALAGDVEAALAAFAGDDPVSAYNRLVLHPDAEDADRIREQLGHPLGVLVDLVLFALGRSDTPPGTGTGGRDGRPGEPGDEQPDGELAALVLAARATALADTDPAGALPLLERAIEAAGPASPALAGVLHGALASLAGQAGLSPHRVIAALESGIGLLTGTDLAVGLAEQHLELGTTFQQLAAERPDLMARAVHHYHCTLQTVSRQQAPELFAAAHANLATAYLTMPMTQASDQLRVGVALASLRAALTVYTPHAHPQRWASAQLNLANALVYAPSAHQGDNLVEAVELYEAVLAARDRNTDPLGYARVLANQGNALAHLGMFDQARGKLVEARFLFEESREYDAVTSVRSVLDEMARRATATAAARAGGES